MDKTLEMSLLFDFYGELLTEKQREYFDLYYNNDLSLSEIAEIAGISRQGVRDMLVRTEASLREFEEKTGAVARFRELQRRVSELEGDVQKLIASASGADEKAAAESIAARLHELTV